VTEVGAAREGLANKIMGIRIVMNKVTMGKNEGIDFPLNMIVPFSLFESITDGDRNRFINIDASNQEGRCSAYKIVVGGDFEKR